MARLAMLAATMLVAALAADVAQTPEATSPGLATVADLAAVAREEAPRWLAAEGFAPPTPAPISRRVLPTREVIVDLTAALTETHSADADEGLYVLYQLLQPARDFAVADLRLLLDTLASVDAKAMYRPMFGLSRDRLVLLQQAAHQPNTEADRRAKPIRAEKHEAERAVIKHNQLVRGIHATLARLRILAADPQADRQVLAGIEADLRDRRVTFLDGLAAIWSGVTQIGSERAAVLYDGLRPVVQQLGDAQTPLADPTKIDQRPEGNSRFEETQRTVGADVAKVVNVLATAARKPAVAVPGARDVPRGRRPGGDRSR
jgi:hypothetical protein